MEKEKIKKTIINFINEMENAMRTYTDEEFRANFASEIRLFVKKINIDDLDF